MYKDFTAAIINSYNFFETYAKVDNFVSTQPDVYFLRHALKEGQAENAKLDKDALAAMEKPTFIETVLRTDPDVIYTSGFVRCKETAEKVQQLLKYYTEKDIPIVLAD